jgi:hypothetical protein
MRAARSTVAARDRDRAEFAIELDVIEAQTPHGPHLAERDLCGEPYASGRERTSRDGRREVERRWDLERRQRSR